MVNGSGGGQTVEDNNYVWWNQIANQGHWIEVRVRSASDPMGPLGLGAKITIYRAGTDVGTAEEQVPNADPECRAFTVVNWPGTAVYTHPVTKTFTMLGLPTMRLHVAAIGNYGQLDARLWDVAPNGDETFVSRGTYALTDNQTGTITWQLWGGGYTFQKADTIRVELLAQDVPMERPSPRSFAVAVSDFTIELPSHEPPDGGEILKPVLAR